MNPISDKNLDKLFQQHFEDIQIEPSKQVWDEISKTLDRKKTKEKSSPILWMAAASIVLLLSTTLWFMKAPEQELKPSSPLVVNESPEEPPVYESEAVEPIQKSRQNIVKLINAQSIITVSDSKDNYTEHLTPISVESPKVEQKPTEVEIVNTNIIVSNTTKRPVIEQPKQIVKVPALYSGDQSSLDLSRPDLTSLAENNDRSSDDDYDFNARNRKVKGVGGLVNFVISKVDKREDKLIEFKESDEGTEISGINLGVLKIKSKK